MDFGGPAEEEAPSGVADATGGVFADEGVGAAYGPGVGVNQTEVMLHVWYKVGRKHGGGDGLGLERYGGC